ncbi:MAG: response regulator [Lachnospiraceae bacterium]|nr:response regulator [Lachnospiraceae bacterium]
MGKSEKNNVPTYLFGAFCFYSLYVISIILYLDLDKRWLIVPVVCSVLNLAVQRVCSDRIDVRAYAMTVLTFISISAYSMMLHEFTEVFTVFCAAVCLISFYHFLKANYLMVVLFTLFMVYKLVLQGEWRYSFVRDGSIAVTIRIFSVYLVQFLMIMLLKRQERTQQIVEQKAQEAEAAAQAKEDFLANMSHEIRTPMNAITGMVELALRNDELPAQEKEYLYSIRAAGEELVSIIDDILDVTKIRSGTLEITEEEYEITSLVHDVVSTIQMMLEEKQVALLVDVNPDIPSRLRGDDVRIKQIMMNLLSNAAKYTERGTIHLTVESAPVSGESNMIDLKVSVTDTGIGIAEEQLKDLFTKFKQADSSRNRSKGGSGLGLVISKRLIDLMRGTIFAKSVLGKGSEFTFTVRQEVIDARPCIATDPQTVLKPSSEQEGRVTTRVNRRKKERQNTTFTAPDAKVLLVDDNKVNLKVAEGLLRPYRMHLDTADSGKLAIDMVQSQNYDLIFMDHMMPVMDGVETTRIIRGMNDDRFKTVPIVALSANAVRGARELFLEAGMNDFVPKPIEMRVMDRALRKWLPDDRIISNRNDDEAINDEAVSDTVGALSWKMEGIDVAVGMKYSGDDENLYREVLSDYMDTIEEKANIIEKAVEEEDLETYTIEVHSLKSISKSIGALELSDLAKDLEANGKNNEWGPIIARTPILLSMYRDLYRVIAPYHTSAGQETVPKQPVNNNELMELLNQLLDSVDTYDSIRAEEIIAELSKFDFTARWDDYMKETADAINRLDYDLCKEKAGKWRSELAQEI